MALNAVELSSKIPSHTGGRVRDTAIKLSRHTGMDCRYPEHREVNPVRPPWPLSSGIPCRNDGFFLNLFVSLVNKDYPHITTERARCFFRPLLQPSAFNDPLKRSGLSRLVDKIIQDVVEPAHQDKRSRLFHICMEVATAAQCGQTKYPTSRISSEESRLLNDLLYKLRLEGVSYDHQAFIPDTRDKPPVRLNGGLF